jgi:hypothetical protein
MPDIVNLPNIATQLGAALGIGTFGGQVLMGFIFMALFLFPTLFICNKSNMNPTLPALIVGLATLCAAVPLFGFPSWVLLLLFLLVGGLWAGISRDWLSGRGSDK